MLHDVNNQANSASNGKLQYIDRRNMFVADDDRVAHQYFNSGQSTINPLASLLSTSTAAQCQTLRTDWAQSKLRHLLALVSHWHQSVTRCSFRSLNNKQSDLP
jgi:hypothetical protein